MLLDVLAVLAELLEVVEVVELLVVGVLNRFRAAANVPVTPLLDEEELLVEEDDELGELEEDDELDELDELLPPPPPPPLRPRIWGAISEAYRSGAVVPVRRRVRSRPPGRTLNVRTATAGAWPGFLVSVSALERACHNKPQPTTAAAGSSAQSARFRFVTGF